MPFTNMCAYICTRTEKCKETEKKHRENRTAHTEPCRRRKNVYINFIFAAESIRKTGCIKFLVQEKPFKFN